jgi:hypothetical protein
MLLLKSVNIAYIPELEFFVTGSARAAYSTHCGLYFENCLYQALSYLTYARCQPTYVWEELTE